MRLYRLNCTAPAGTVVFNKYNIMLPIRGTDTAPFYFAGTSPARALHIILHTHTQGGLAIILLSIDNTGRKREWGSNCCY